MLVQGAGQHNGLKASDSGKQIDVLNLAICIASSYEPVIMYNISMLLGIIAPAYKLELRNCFAAVTTQVP